jgi:acetyl-CoA carboxylase biotin carboxyl carrier protein
MAKAKNAAPKKAPAKKAVTKPIVATSKANSSSPSPVFNIDEITDLLQAVKKSNVSKLKLEKGDFKITIKQGGSEIVTVHATAPSVVATAPVAQAIPPPAPSIAAPITGGSDNTITIKSPMIGTFYRSAGPGKPLFVNVGDEIKEGQVLCIVEAMKLFNEIESEYSGKIVKVLIDDASPVEYDQPLFLIQP